MSKFDRTEQITFTSLLKETTDDTDGTDKKRVAQRFCRCYPWHPCHPWSKFRLVAAQSRAGTFESFVVPSRPIDEQVSKYGDISRRNQKGTPPGWRGNLTGGRFDGGFCHRRSRSQSRNENGILTQRRKGAKNFIQPSSDKDAVFKLTPLSVRPLRLCAFA